MFIAIAEFSVPPDKVVNALPIDSILADYEDKRKPHLKRVLPGVRGGPRASDDPIERLGLQATGMNQFESIGKPGTDINDIVKLIETITSDMEVEGDSDKLLSSTNLLDRMVKGVLNK